MSYDIFAPVVEAIAAKTSILKPSSMTTGSIDFLLVEVRLVRANQVYLDKYRLGEVHLDHQIEI